MASKKDKVTTKKERETLLTSYQSINMLSRSLGIKESVIKAWMVKHRPTYQQEFESHEHTDSRVTAAIEKKVDDRKAMEEEIRTQIMNELNAKKDAELQKELQTEIANNTNDAMEKLMAHKEIDSKGNRRFVTIMTPGASERGDEYRRYIKKNDLDQPHIHRPKRTK